MIAASPIPQPTTNDTRTSKIIRRNDMDDFAIHGRRLVRVPTRDRILPRDQSRFLSPQPTRVRRKRHHPPINVLPLPVHPHTTQPRRSQRARREKHPSGYIFQPVSDVGPRNERQRLRRRDTPLGENVN